MLNKIIWIAMYRKNWLMYRIFYSTYANLLSLIKETATYVKSFNRIMRINAESTRVRGSTREISTGLRTSYVIHELT